MVGRFHGMFFLICETFKISCLMGRLHTKGVLENNLKDQSFRLVHWLSITQFLRKTSQESINFGKIVLGLFLGYALYAGRIWKGDIMVPDIEDLETMDASEIYSERLNAKEVIFLKENGKIHFSSRRWTKKNCWRRSGTENIHLDTGTPNSRRKSKGFSWRIRMVSSSTTSRLFFFKKKRDSAEDTSSVQEKKKHIYARARSHQSSVPLLSLNFTSQRKVPICAGGPPRNKQTHGPPHRSVRTTTGVSKPTQPFAQQRWF